MAIVFWGLYIDATFGAGIIAIAYAIRHYKSFRRVL